MCTSTKYSFQTMTLFVKLFCLFLVVNASHENREQGEEKTVVNKVNLSDNYVVEWSINETASSVDFKVNVLVDEKGWVLLGFMNAPRNKSATQSQPAKISDSRGDFVITWPSSAEERTIADSNTIKTPGVLEKDDNSTTDYHVTVQHIKKNNSEKSVLTITRKLDTGDPQDVPITDQPLWMFGAYGNSDDYVKDLSAIKSNIDDTLVGKEVIIVKNNNNNNNNKDKNQISWKKVLKEQVKKHWITVVLAVSGVLTVVIIGTVYCCFKKSSGEFRGRKGKKVKMTFYKEDEDDEARVAFLHSHT